MPLNQVETWFLQLAIKKKFLTVEQVYQFVDRAFCGNSSIDKITAKLDNSELEIMGALFYRYYRRCVELGLAPSKGKQQDYIGLLTKNFTNYAHLEKSLSTNFSKYHKRKNAWADTI